MKIPSLRWFLAILTLAALSGVVSGAPTQAVNLLPVGYWNLDDTASPAKDLIAGANGIWNGSPTRVTAGLPTFTYGNASALTFSNAGADQYVQIPNSTALNSIQTNSYSISAWFNPASIPPGTGSANNAAYGVVIKPGWHEGIIYDSNQKFEFQHWASGNVWTGTGSWGVAYPPGSWYHVVAVWDNTAGVVQMWVNGIMQGSAAEAPNSQNRDFGTAAWYIGIANPGAGAYRWNADGSIDDVRLYNYALSGNQIQVLYQGCPTPTGLGGTPAVGAVNLSWTAPTGPAVTYTYNIKRGSGPGTETTIATGVSGTTYSDTGGVPGTLYYYVVTAVNAAESGPSNEISCRSFPISVTPTSLTVVEAGGTATFSINLLTPLANGATLSTTASVSSAAPAAPVLLSNGGAPAASLPISFTGDGVTLLSQTITVTGVDDFIAANPWTATINFSATVSSDPIFNNASLPPVTVNQIESDFPGVIITPSTGLSVTNGGPAVSFTVQLASKPTANVMIPMTLTMPDLGTVAGPGGVTTLTFTPANWNTPQTVVLTPTSADTTTTYITSYQITFTPVTGDASYQNFPVPPLPVFEPTSIPPLKKVWGGCGLLGPEGAVPLFLAALLGRWTRRRR
jgi:hypothetical protein